MNNTKKITQGAMLLAIYGAILAIDRMLGSFFDVIVVLIPAVLINLYSAMHKYSDGVYFSIGIAILTFIFGGADFVYLVYVPVSIFTGLVYSYGIKHDFSSIKLLLISVISFIGAEFLISNIVLPLLGQPSIISFASEEGTKQLISETSEMMKGIGLYNEESMSIIQKDSVGLVRTAIILTMVTMGFFEGIIIHMLTKFLFVKFKILDIRKTNIFNIKPNKILAYVSMLCIIGVIASIRFVDFNKYYNFVSIISIPAIFGIFYLWFYGYIFVLLYMRVTMGIKVGPLIVIILILFFSTFFIICGFLYATGPFQKLIVVRQNEEQ